MSNSYGFLKHCDYHILKGLLEDVNKKIRVIKRNAYAFNDLR
jgi:transposase